jgi:hypothetical protein
MRDKGLAVAVLMGVQRSVCGMTQCNHLNNLLCTNQIGDRNSLENSTSASKQDVQYNKKVIRMGFSSQDCLEFLCHSVYTECLRDLNLVCYTERSVETETCACESVAVA